MAPRRDEISPSMAERELLDGDYNVVGQQADEDGPNDKDGSND